MVVANWAMLAKGYTCNRWPSPSKSHRNTSGSMVVVAEKVLTDNGPAEGMGLARNFMSEVRARSSKTRSTLSCEE